MSSYNDVINVLNILARKESRRPPLAESSITLQVESTG